MGTDLTHFDEEGRARMVDVGGKEPTKREAVARGTVLMKAETFRRIRDKEIQKGDVLGVARVAGIMAAKRTPDIIPMCHPIPITGVDVYFYPDKNKNAIEVESVVRTTGQTGVEMDALMSVSVAALTIYDMCKSIDKGMSISDIRLMKKTGGKSGDYVRED